MIHDDSIRRHDQERFNDDPAPKWYWRQPLQPPARVFTRGNAVTRIWANPGAWGDVVWTVDQICISYHDGERHISHTFDPHQLTDAIRGLQDSKTWITRANRRQRLRRLLSWLR